MFYKIISAYSTRFQDRILKLLAGMHGFPALLSRIALAAIFIPTGFGKIKNIQNVIAYFTELAIPAPIFQAHLVAYTEFACGIAFLLGLFTRIATIPIIIIMCVALFTAHLNEITEITALVKLTPFLIIIVCFWLLVFGPGQFTLKQFLRPKIHK